MTRMQAVGVLLIALGLIYALLYFAWARKKASNTSAAVVAERPGPQVAGSASTDGTASDDLPSDDLPSDDLPSDDLPSDDVAPDDVAPDDKRESAAGADPRPSADYGDVEPPRAANQPAISTTAVSQVIAEGTYISTTTTASRHDRVNIEGLGNRARSVFTVRRGDLANLVRIEREGEQDVVISGDRLVAVRRDRGMAGKFMGAARIIVLTWRADDDAEYETGFLPRHKVDAERIEAALWWHAGQVGGGGGDSRPGVTGEPRTDDATKTGIAQDGDAMKPSAAKTEDPTKTSAAETSSDTTSEDTTA